MDLITRTAKQYLEQVYFQVTEAQLFNKIFNIADESTASGFMLDSLVQSPYALTYRAKNGEARVVQYAPGSGVLIEPPIGSIKTPLTENLLDKVIAGIDGVDGYGPNEAQLVNKIVRQHVSQINMLKNKQALDVLADGVFNAYGPGGVNTGQEVVFVRNAALNMTYNFTALGATITEAFAQAESTMRGFGLPFQNNVVILGSNWQGAWNNDTEIQTYTQSNASNSLLLSQLAPPELSGAEGLYILGQYRGKGMLAPLWVCAYAPPIAYVKDDGENSEPYVGANNAIFFSMSDTRYKVNRGVNVLDEYGKRMRAVGDIVVDRFSDNDPVCEYIRSSTRHCFVPGMINHTGKSVGTF